MDHLLTGENPPDSQDPPPAAAHIGPTGPRSPQGKVISSQNRLTHGCRSETLLLRTEDPAEFEFNMNFWFEQYKPQDGLAEMLVDETARAHWMLKRNQKRLAEVESNLPTLPYCWTDDNHKQFTNFTRYKTTAERSFFRNFKELEAHYDKLSHADELKTRARAAAAKLEMQWLNQLHKAATKELKVEQLVEVHTVDGQCTTVYYPTNQEILKDIAKAPAPPMVVTRYIEFLQGVPAEYNWADPSKLKENLPSLSRQTMLYDHWLEIIEREKTTGHIGPIRHLNP